MAWFILAQMFSTLLTLLRLGHTSDKDKDLEILILRQQLNIRAVWFVWLETAVAFRYPQSSARGHHAWAWATGITYLVA